MPPRRLCPILLAAVAALAVAAPPAAAWEVSPAASAASFSAFHRLFAEDAYAYPRHGAAPLGLTGFRVYAELAGDPGFDDAGPVSSALRGSVPGGLLLVARAGVRKGLPGGFDLGLSYGRALSGGLGLVSGEVQWAVLRGGALEPAVAVRLTGTESRGGGPYELRQLGAEVLVSKGFTVVTPYLGGGLVASRGRLERTGGGRFEETGTRGVVYAGLTVNLILPKLTFEVERGREVHGAVRLAFGF